MNTDYDFGKAQTGKGMVAILERSSQYLENMAGNVAAINVSFGRVPLVLDFLYEPRGEKKDEAVEGHK